MADDAKTSIFKELRREWAGMSLYERFEQAVALTLALFIAIIIVLSLVRLLVSALPLLLGGVLDPLEPQTFSRLFGMIMTVLIAMEFKHSIIRVALRKDSIIQVKTVMLIALLALGRKFIILDTSKTDATTIAALSAGLLALGVVYWLMRERDDRN
ncbi:MAG: phosphate-starvation-inducible PsiE family protein [Gammaproteobacteria bacterium]|nr:phosphate-starvation-inducible PsiE family protein [Gammaproteobacteria bacterium]